MSPPHPAFVLLLLRMTSSPPTALQAPTDAEARLSRCLRDNEELVSELPAATLAAAARRVALLAATGGSQGGVRPSRPREFGWAGLI